MASKAFLNALRIGAIEDNATADLTASEIKTLYESNADTNRFSDTHQSLLDSIGETVTWTTPTLLNAWVEYGTSWGVAGYYKDSSGTVHLRGLVKSGALGTDVFVLPVGYRPIGRKIIMNSSNNAVGRLDILATGNVRPQTYGSNVWFSLSCSFKAEQ